jgi:hemerythrin
MDAGLKIRLSIRDPFAVLNVLPLFSGTRFSDIMDKKRRICVVAVGASMDRIEWKPEFSVCVAEIDEQHQKLYAIINELRSAQRDALDYKAILTILSQLVDYSDYHFRTEDNYMIEINYPQFLSHRKEHLAYVKRTGEFIAALESDQAALSQQILNFLCEWWQSHIINSDLKYARYAKSQKKAQS